MRRHYHHKTVGVMVTADDGFKKNKIMHKKKTGLTTNKDKANVLVIF